MDPTVLNAGDLVLVYLPSTIDPNDDTSRETELFPRFAAVLKPETSRGVLVLIPDRGCWHVAADDVLASWHPTADASGLLGRLRITLGEEDMA
jgi:hypothetical protein